MAERFSEFDISQAAEALGAEPGVTRDVAHGQGHTMSAGDTTLEIYRDAGVARVTTPDARIELFRVPTYHVSAERLVLEQGDLDARTRLLVRSDGRVSFYPVARATESSSTGETVSSDVVVSSTLAESSMVATARPDSVSAAGQEDREQEQLQLTGRLGRDPWFNDQGDQPTAGFPLAVNADQGKTTWHRVVVAGELVEQVRAGLQTGQIKKGRLVQLSGTEVVQSEPTAKGGTRKTTEFHATVLTPINASRTRPAR
jgi:hypothetical protein